MPRVPSARHAHTPARRRRHRITRCDSDDAARCRPSCHARGQAQLADGGSVNAQSYFIVYENGSRALGHSVLEVLAAANFGCWPIATRATQPGQRASPAVDFSICRRLQQQERASSSPPDSASVNHAIIRQRR